MSITPVQCLKRLVHINCPLFILNIIPIRTYWGAAERYSMCLRHKPSLWEEGGRGVCGHNPASGWGLGGSRGGFCRFALCSKLLDIVTWSWISLQYITIAVYRCFFQFTDMLHPSDTLLKLLHPTKTLFYSFSFSLHILLLNRSR